MGVKMFEGRAIRSRAGEDERVLRSSHFRFSSFEGHASYGGHSSPLRRRRMADREGFEPSVPMKVHTLSKRAHSTTLTSVLCLLQLRLYGERVL